MWVSLEVRELAVVERLDVVFDAGLNVITGETGAGKSLVLAALGIALGGRAAADVVRAGAEAAEVTAGFRVDGAVQEYLATLGVEAADGHVEVRRRVPIAGRGGTWVNGIRVRLADLRALGAQLVHMVAQHAQRELSDPEARRSLLDAFGAYGGLLTEMQASWEQLAVVSGELSSLEQALEARAEREEMLRFHVADLQSLDLRSGEVAALREERDVMLHGAELRKGLAGVERLLFEGDASAARSLARAESIVRSLSSVDGRLGPLSQELADLMERAADAARSAQAARARVDVDPQRLELVDQRLAEADRLARRHRVQADELPDVARAVVEELAELGTLEARHADLVGRHAAARARALACADALSAARREAARRLAGELERRLHGLAMPGARVALQVSSEGALGPQGRDAVEILLSANQGEELRPAARVASGGEQSRLMLAFQLTLSEVGPSVLLLDEVDAGLGGLAADDVARTLRALAEQGRQLVVVSHLPQIAAAANTHLCVRKVASRGRVSSAIDALAGAARAEELARMVGGAAVGPASRACAVELLTAWRTGRLELARARVA